MGGAVPQLPASAPLPPLSDRALSTFSDAVELFFAGSSSDLTGVGPDPGTIHVVAQPPSPGDPDGGGTAGAYRSNVSGQVGPLRLLTPSEFRARLVPGKGFNIEIELDWVSFGAPPADAGTQAGFDLGVDLMLPGDGGGAHLFQSFYYVNPEGTNGVCPPGNPQPACSDRTWCKPVLQ
jgi:hypothetical protein